MRSSKHTRTVGLILGLTAILALALVASPASAAVGPKWRADSLSSSTVAPGEMLEYLVQLSNVGDAAMTGDPGDPIEVTATLPTGLRPVSGQLHLDSDSTESNFVDCTEGNGEPLGDPSDPTHVKCENTTHVPAYNLQFLRLTVEAEASTPPGFLESSFTVSGGGAAQAASTVDPVQVTNASPTFGIDAFDTQLSKANGAATTQAAAHPATDTTSIDFNTYTNPLPIGGTGWPVEPTKDVLVDLPPGLVGNTTAADQCAVAQLAYFKDGLSSKTLCPPEAQVGLITLAMNNRPIGATAIGPLPIFNMVSPPGVPARFAFIIAGTIVTLDARVRSSSDYSVSVDSRNISEALPLAGSTVDFWGVPADPSHDTERACPEKDPPSASGKTCASDAEPTAFLRTPTTCSGAGLRTTAHADSWFKPGVFDSKSTVSHLAPGFPALPTEWGPEQGQSGCDEVPFEPSLSLATTTNQADSPTGLSVDIGLPSDCWEPKQTAEEAEEAICQSDMREAKLTLPEGLSLNPSAANGLQGCSASQVGLSTPLSSSPVHFDEAPANCPDSSKIGTAQVTTPLLSEPLNGAVYLATQSQNPFGSLLAMYLVAEGSGVVVKQAGEIELGPGGQLTTRFDEVPQQPFSKIHVELFGGPGAPLRTPPTCGAYAAQATLTPWSGNGAVDVSSSFQITGCPNSGFDPRLRAGVQNPLAGATSPFSLRLSREDGSQELGGLRVTLPPGLSGYLKGIPYCPDSALAAVSGALGTGVGQETSPSCPAASQVGTLNVGAGAGPEPFYTSSGRAYLAGPYKGAPLSLAVIAPAVAGPFDLGSVLVRNALHVDPETAQITVESDPFPTILHGIPLDLRDVRVDISREHFTLNPTSCEPFQIGSTVTSAQGASAHPSPPFQVAGCERLGFKPKLGLKLKGATKRGENPALTAVMRPRAGDANAARIQVALPHSEFLAQDHIKTICTRVQFAADQCPKGSIYGKVTAITPILDQPLTGNVYLRSSNHNLPDLVLALRGPASQPIEIDAVGRIDSIHGGIRTTFEQVPDAPLTKVVLRMPGGQKSLLENSRDICRKGSRAMVEMDAHNGRTSVLRPELRAPCRARR